ncbi:MAG: hypothetical protein WAW17_15190 [Rhodococcus sp. (in: high G+C Gram-positive bacteria)]|uniref:hypothetical protein n=1 Tax=Rhodococcus sp. TaxID=1831 RepID=UPI003BAEC7E2
MHSASSRAKVCSPFSRALTEGPQAQMPDLSVAARNVGLYLQMQSATGADLLEAQVAFEPRCARLARATLFADSAHEYSRALHRYRRHFSRR